MKFGWDCSMCGRRFVARSLEALRIKAVEHHDRCKAKLERTLDTLQRKHAAAAAQGELFPTEERDA